MEAQPKAGEVSEKVPSTRNVLSLQEPDGQKLKERMRTGTIIDWPGASAGSGIIISG
jgi:hypothetical protein